MVQAVSALPPFPADSTCRAPHCLHLLGYALCLSTLRQEHLCATLFCELFTRSETSAYVPWRQGKHYVKPALFVTRRSQEGQWHLQKDEQPRCS